MSSLNPCYKPEKLNLNAAEKAAFVRCHRPGVAVKQSVKGLLAGWLHNWRSRRQLAQLDDAALKDIGVSRVDALQEADKPFWR